MANGSLGHLPYGRGELLDEITVVDDGQNGTLKLGQGLLKTAA